MRTHDCPECGAWSGSLHAEDCPALETQMLSEDVVNHPPHYTQGGVECIDAIKAAVAGASPVEAVFVANIVKYVWRYRHKNGMADLHKARWYLNALIEEVESRVDEAG